MAARGSTEFNFLSKEYRLCQQKIEYEAGQSHIAAACGSFKSLLLENAATSKLANPTARQRVDRSSSLY
jgi:hypothetical protein